MSTPHSPSMFLPIRNYRWEELSTDSRQLSSTETDTSLSTRSVSNVSNALARLVPNTRPLTFSSRESVPNPSSFDVDEQFVRGTPLSEVDTHNLKAEQVLFYFGVLALRYRHIQPVFEYTQESDRRWSAKLTMCRDSLKLPSMRSLLAAKVEICRVALSILKKRCGEWEVPDEPSQDLTALEWRWFSLLQEYTKEKNLPLPQCSRYLHKMGYRYEMAVGDVTGLGKRKFYASEDQAIAAAAHEVLYLLLTGELQSSPGVLAAGMPLSPMLPAQTASSVSTVQGTFLQTQDTIRMGNVPPPIVNKVTNNSVLSGDMSKPTVAGHGGSSQQAKAKNINIPKGPKGASAYKVSKPSRAKPKRSKSRKGNGGQANDYMSNLLPVVNPRISIDQVHSEPEQTRKWNTSPGSLSKELKKQNTYQEKFDKLCSILGLNPSFKTEKTDPPLPAQPPSIFECKANEKDPVPSYTVWTTFQDDPFLARAGEIGKIEGFHGSQPQALDLCCKKTIEYVMALVKEDYALEQKEREHQSNIDKFAETKIEALKKNGHLIE